MCRSVSNNLTVSTDICMAVWETPLDVAVEKFS